MPTLLEKTQAALDAFNDARTTHDYSGIAQYLAPQVTIYRVDDPGFSVQGTPAHIVQFLNARQNNKWPQLKNRVNFALNPRSPNVVLGGRTESVKLHHSKLI